MRFSARTAGNAFVGDPVIGLHASTGPPGLDRQRAAVNDSAPTLYTPRQSRIWMVLCDEAVDRSR